MRNIFKRKNKEKKVDYRKKCIYLRVLAVLLTLALGWMVYLNYNYMVFKALIGEHYIYTDTLDMLYEEALQIKDTPGFSQEFDYWAIAALTEKIRTLNGDRYTYLYSPERYRLSKETEKKDAARSSFYALTEDTVYASLANFSTDSRKWFLSNKKEFGGYANMILDLRDNYGGMLSDCYKIAELFLEKGEPIAYENTRWGLFTRDIQAKKDPYFHFDQIVILQNENTASAAEVLIMALKENMDNVTLVGKTTFGKGIGQITIPLKKGYAVRATVLKMSTPTGQSIHQVGITPDMLYEEENILEYALENIIKQY